MGVLSVKDLQANMVLAEDLKDRSGRLLMTKGTVLTEKYLKICRMWGVIEAHVEGISSDEINVSALIDRDSVKIAAAKEAVHKRFFDDEADHPATRELARLCILRMAEGKKNDGDHGAEGRWTEKEIVAFEKEKPLNINPVTFINEDTKLSTLPDIYRHILDAISKPNSSAYDIENVISKDTNLAARLLKIVNSAFYGYPSRIDTLSRAVNIVGIKQLSTLAIGVNVICMFNNIPPEIVNMKMFWKHSVLCGICARILAGYKNIQNTERMFVIGLLHDIGRLVLYNYLTRESLYAVTTARNNRQPLYLAERDLFGLDHAAIGGLLLTKWQMPMSLEDTVQNHHSPLKANNRVESSIAHIADIIANAMGIGTSGETHVPQMNREAWTQLGLTPNIFSLTMEQADRQLEDVFELFYADDRSPQRK